MRRLCINWEFRHFIRFLLKERQFLCILVFVRVTMRILTETKWRCIFLCPAKAQEEAITLMMPRQNLLKPADGSPITLPNKEMAVGVFYLTSINRRCLRKEENQNFGELQRSIFGPSLWEKSS